MRVSTLYTDSSGTYRVRADIRENNRTVHIIDIIDNEYGGEADWDDFTEEEQGAIHLLLLEEYAALDRDEDSDYTNDREDDEDDDDPPNDY